MLADKVRQKVKERLVRSEGPQGQRARLLRAEVRTPYAREWFARMVRTLNARATVFRRNPKKADARCAPLRARMEGCKTGCTPYARATKCAPPARANGNTNEAE